MSHALSLTGTPMAAATPAVAQALAVTTTQAEAQPLAQTWTTTLAQDLPPAGAAAAVAVAVVLPVLSLAPRRTGTSMSGRAMTSKVLALARAVAATPGAVGGLALMTTTTMRGATLAVVVLAVAVGSMVTTMGTTGMSMQEQVLQQVSRHFIFCAFTSVLAVL